MQINHSATSSNHSPEPQEANIASTSRGCALNPAFFSPQGAYTYININKQTFGAPELQTPPVLAPFFGDVREFWAKILLHETLQTSFSARLFPSQTTGPAVGDLRSHSSLPHGPNFAIGTSFLAPSCSILALRGHKIVLSPRRNTIF